MKQVIASIRYLYLNVLQRPITKSLFIELKEPVKFLNVFKKGLVILVIDSGDCVVIVANADV